jgi:lysozyme
MSRQINQAGLDLIKQYEGFRPNPYVDVAGHVTIGYGTTHYQDGTEVTMQDQPIDEPTAAQLLEDLLNNEFCPQVENVIKVTITDNQFAALVSFTYNMGIGSLTQSTILRCTNASNWDDASRAFLLWNKARVGGELVAEPGLTKRRQVEADLFLS